MLEEDLSGRLALVTGGTDGIGLATCHALASLGCSIAVHYHSAASIAETLVTELLAKGVRVESFQAKLRQYDDVRSLHENVTHSMGAPAILFNNAGITMNHGVKDISEVSVEMFEETWRANCGSAFLLTQVCLPEMEKLGWAEYCFAPASLDLPGVWWDLIMRTNS